MKTNRSENSGVVAGWFSAGGNFISGLIAVVLLGAAFQAAAAPVPNVARERISFNDGWRFTKDDPADAGDQLSYEKLKAWILPTGAELTTNAPAARPEGNPGAAVVYTQDNFDDHDWRKINLPHDWAVEGPFEQKNEGSTGKLKYWGPVWYRKHFTLPGTDYGKKIKLDIDGAMSFSEVWLNGQFVGGWPYGYSSFELDLTPYLKANGGENVLAIRLNSPSESSRWYPGAGLFRNLWLVKTAPVHVGHWGTYITTPKVRADAATVELRVNLENDGDGHATVAVKNEIFELNATGAKGRSIASITTDGFEVGARQSKTSGAQIIFGKPKLWSLKHPQRYVCVTSIAQNGRLVDSVETPFGIRTVEFTAEKGLTINGESVKMNGVCDHHDLGALGAAVNTRALERQIQILQEMGCNAIRTSHNPPAPELLDLCDRMGMVVMDETFDCWVNAKRPGDYHRVYSDWHEKDTRALIRRDRNHPSVILWSIGNEISEQGRRSQFNIGEELAAIVHSEDPTRPVTAACNNGQAGYNGFQHVVDVFGYNYKPYEYARFRATNSNIPLFGSETASCISSRGEYFFPVTDDKSKGQADFQMSSYDLYAPRWATIPDAEFKGQDANPFVAGEFVWTGFDYIGEPTPYDSDRSNLLNYTDPAEKARAEQELKELGKIKVPSRSSYFGILDLAGFKKDRFYIYQAHWRPDFPMAHILPHWNWPDRTNQVTPVHVYTSGDEAELFLNGKSLGKNKKGPLEYRLRWDDVVYQPGTLKVVAYKNGKRWATDVVKTTGPAAQLKLQADRTHIHPDGKDLSYLTLSVADKNGLMVPRSKNKIFFDIDGPGEIVATDNGDATDLTVFQTSERKAYNGLCLVIVRAKPGQSGGITVTAQSEGLEPAVAIVRAR